MLKKIVCYAVAASFIGATLPDAYAQMSGLGVNRSIPSISPKPAPPPKAPPKSSTVQPPKQQPQTKSNSKLDAAFAPQNKANNLRSTFIKKMNETNRRVGDKF